MIANTSPLLIYLTVVLTCSHVQGDSSQPVTGQGGSTMTCKLRKTGTPSVAIVGVVLALVMLAYALAVVLP
jgi:hypothetical protein